MGKVKVLQFPIGNTGGGITRYVLNNWKYIDRSRIQFDFVTLNKTLDFESELIEEGCKVHYISCYAEDDKKRFAEEVGRILESGYDVIHLHTSYWKSFLVEELAKAYHVPKVIIHSHNTMIDMIDKEQREKSVELHNLQKSHLKEDIATDFCACSNLAADWLYGDKIPKNRIKIMPNAIDISKFSYDEGIRENYRRSYHLEDKFVIGHVGRFVYQKNHEFLMDVFYQVCQQRENVRLVLIGKGPMEEQIKQKAKNLGVREKVLFLGAKDDVNNWMQAMDVFALPSRFEGLPIVLIEAQCCGLSCIGSSDITDEVLVTPNAKLLPLNAKAWEGELMEISSKELERRTMELELRRARYDIRCSIKKLERLYLSGGYSTRIFFKSFRMLSQQICFIRKYVCIGEGT